MSDIDETTGLPTAAWEPGIDRKGRVQAVWKQEDEYVIKKIGDGQWSLVEAGESLGSFATALAAAEALPKLEFNPWEDIDGRNQNLYLSLAPVDFDEWVSGETDNIFLRCENGAWWLSVTGETGQSVYPTRQQGMIAGLEAYRESYDKSHEKIIKSLGLDDSDWRFEFENGNIIATYLHDESISLQADDNSNKWAMFNGEDIVGNYDSVKDAAAAVPVRSMTL
jgi:hypothetical protein